MRALVLVKTRVGKQIRTEILEIIHAHLLILVPDILGLSGTMRAHPGMLVMKVSDPSGIIHAVERDLVTRAMQPSESILVRASTPVMYLLGEVLVITLAVDTTLVIHLKWE